MPQMMPLNWLFLYFMFLMTYAMFIYMNFYITSFNNKNNLLLMNKKNYMLWKW
uniref:ATP synthase F0 subunit 8 n=1 Tax=Adicella ragma TaxID=2904898 RepID=A0A9E8LPV1_9NEOP|nr:ATP synthase F0 subunit 8 [Adicella ragma]UZZ43717.1 ATP synthase F0 subunit 8 [Adicella ragma]